MDLLERILDGGIRFDAADALILSWEPIDEAIRVSMLNGVVKRRARREKEGSARVSSPVIGTEVVTALKVKDFARIHATMEESKNILAESRRQLGRASAIVRALQELEVTICCTPRPRVTRCFRKGEPRLAELPGSE